MTCCWRWRCPESPRGFLPLRCEKQVNFSLTDGTVYIPFTGAPPLPARLRTTLQMSWALAVFPAPSSFPMHTEAAALIPRGNCKDRVKVKPLHENKWSDHNNTHTMYIIAPISMITCWAARSTSPRTPGVVFMTPNSTHTVYHSGKPDSLGCQSENQILGSGNSTNQPGNLQPPRTTTQSRPLAHWEWPASCGTPNPAGTQCSSLMGFTQQGLDSALQPPGFKNFDTYAWVTSPCFVI